MSKIQETPNFESWKLVLHGAGIIQRETIAQSPDRLHLILGVSCVMSALREVFGDASGIDELGNIFECDPELLLKPVGNPEA